MERLMGRALEPVLGVFPLSHTCLGTSTPTEGPEGKGPERSFPRKHQKSKGNILQQLCQKSGEEEAHGWPEQISESSATPSDTVVVVPRPDPPFTSITTTTSTPSTTLWSPFTLPCTPK
ncbi:hypothetical protein VTO42DRAFT_450 [Malbranchea cinnamomea]